MRRSWGSSTKLKNSMVLIRPCISGIAYPPTPAAYAHNLYSLGTNFWSTVRTSLITTIISFLLNASPDIPFVWATASNVEPELKKRWRRVDGEEDEG